MVSSLSFLWMRHGLRGFVARNGLLRRFRFVGGGLPAFGLMGLCERVQRVSFDWTVDAV